MTTPRDDGYTRDDSLDSGRDQGRDPGGGPPRSEPAGDGERPSTGTPGGGRRGPRRSVTPGLVIGLFVIGLGLVLFLEQLGHDTGSILRWWPVVLIVLGAVKVTERPGRGFGVVLLGVGTALLLDSLDLIEISDWWFLWPLAVIAVGALLVWRALRAPSAPVARGGSDGTFHALAVLSGIERRIVSRDFEGGEATAVLGACEIDLRRAEMAGEQAVIEVFALLGGIELFIPEGWEVEIRGTPLLGGFEDRSRPAPGTGAPRLIVQGVVILAGVEVIAR